MVSEPKKQQKRILGLTYLDNEEKLHIYVPSGTDIKQYRDTNQDMFPSNEQVARKAISEIGDHFPSAVNFYTHPEGPLHHLKNGTLNNKKLVPSLFNRENAMATLHNDALDSATKILEHIWETGYESYVGTTSGSVWARENSEYYDILTSLARNVVSGALVAGALTGVAAVSNEPELLKYGVGGVGVFFGVYAADSFVRSYKSLIEGERARKLIASYAMSNRNAQIAPEADAWLPVSSEPLKGIRVMDGKYKK
jgi:hypothetical protein